MHPPEESRRAAVHDFRQSVQSIHAWIELCRFYIDQNDKIKANDALNRLFSPLENIERKAEYIVLKFKSEREGHE